MFLTSSTFIIWVFTHKFISFCCLIAITGVGRWLITYVNHSTGDSFSRELYTSQSRDELIQRSASAMKKRSGLTSFFFRVRNGFYVWNENETLNGQKLKDK